MSCTSVIRIRKYFLGYPDPQIWITDPEPEPTDTCTSTGTVPGHFHGHWKKFLNLDNLTWYGTFRFVVMHA